jgi:hypothetical protein
MTTEVFNADYKKALAAAKCFHNSLWFMMTLWMMRHVVDIKLFMRSGMNWNFVWRCNVLAYQYFEQYEAPNFYAVGEVVQQNSTEV